MIKNETNPAYPDTMKTIAVDFDGVIHGNDLGFNGGKVEDAPIKGVKWALKTLHGMGYKLIVFSCKARTDRPIVNGASGITLIKRWLIDWGLWGYISDVTAVKPPCILLIDDNAYRFDNWRNVMKFINPYVTQKDFDKHNEKIRSDGKV